MRLVTIQKLVLITLFTLSISVFADDKIDWTGFYGSATVGRAWGHVSEGDGTGDSSQYFPIHNTISDGIGADLRNWSGNLKLGYNKQFDNNLIGIELGGTLQSSESKNGVMNTKLNGEPDTPNATFTKTRIRDYETISVRLGHIFNEKSLVYLKAGAVTGEIKRSLTDTGAGYGGYLNDWLSLYDTVTNKKRESGYVLGFGSEYKLNDRWALRADYEYIDFGNVNFDYNFSVCYDGVGCGPAKITQSNSIHFSNLSAGVSYAF